MEEIRTGEWSISQNTLLRIGMLSLALGWLYFDVLRKLISDWYVDENYSHGLLVPFIGGYAIWQNRDRFQGLALKPLNVLGWLGIISAVALLWAGTLGAELFSTRISLIAALISLILYFAGFNWLKHLSFPLVLLALLIWE